MTKWSQWPDEQSRASSGEEIQRTTTAGAVGSRRLQEIEKILGFSPLLDDGKDIDTYNIILVNHNQTIRLIKAFDRIKDPLVRENMLEMLEDAADRDSPAG